MNPTRQHVSATIRAFSSLSRRDADAVRATIRAAASSYTVQEHDDYEGYLSLLLTPADETRPSYMVAGRTGAVDVAELRGDEMAALGLFPSVGAAMAVLRPFLERYQPGSTAPTAAAAAATFRQRYGADARLHAAIEADATPSRPGWSAVLRTLDDFGAS